jgi:hypothetical protein
LVQRKHLLVWLSLQRLTSGNLGFQKGNFIDKLYRQKPTQRRRQWFEGISWKFCAWMELYVLGGTNTFVFVPGGRNASS